MYAACSIVHSQGQRHMSARSYIVDDRERKEVSARSRGSGVGGDGAYRYILRRASESFRIKERRVLIDAHELSALGSVSVIL